MTDATLAAEPLPLHGEAEVVLNLALPSGLLVLCLFATDGVMHPGEDKSMLSIMSSEASSMLSSLLLEHIEDGDARANGGENARRGRARECGGVELSCLLLGVVLLLLLALLFEVSTMPPNFDQYSACRCLIVEGEDAVVASTEDGGGGR